MNLKALTYGLYLLATVPMTIYVARTLFRHGAVFLRDVFGGNTDLADAVNHLLVVGFYLFNLGYVALLLQTDQTVDTPEAVFEVLTNRVGIVAVVLGVVHLANVFVLNKIRRHGTFQNQTTPPVAAEDWTTVRPR